jgi:hypothetical protein
LVGQPVGEYMNKYIDNALIYKRRMHSSIYFVQFDENTRPRLMVIEVIFRSAREPVLNVHFAHLPITGKFVIVTVMDVLPSGSVHARRVHSVN